MSFGEQEHTDASSHVPDEADNKAESLTPGDEDHRRDAFAQIVRQTRSLVALLFGDAVREHGSSRGSVPGGLCGPLEGVRQV